LTYSILENISLKPYNTFGIDAKAKLFFEVTSVDELLWITQQEVFKNSPLILGGGSNILLTGDYDGLVVKLDLKGRKIESARGDRTIVSAMAGENWHRFVLWTLDQNLGGLENLSLIPGNVGTAPIQNIGAYGVELKDTFHHLEALNLKTGNVEELNASDCQFGYRNSVFKNEAKGQYIITKVYFELSNKEHKLNTGYGAIEQELKRLDEEKSIHSISKAVINIRQSKLPDPAEIGNSGSFFKNPVLSNSTVQKIKAKHPELVTYPVDNEHSKVAAGWLIERDGWKGKRFGDAGVHAKQALVLVNYGNAKGSEIRALAEQIKASVFRNFGVSLEAEVNII